MKKNVTSTIYICTFIISVMIIGLLSMIKLSMFYCNGENNTNEWDPNMGTEFEANVAFNIFAKYSFINMNGAFRNALGQREMNGITKLNNKYLTNKCAYVDDATLETYVSNLISFKDYCDQNKIELLFAIAPYTICKYDSQLPKGFISYYQSSNDNSDRLLSLLEQYDINTIDFRETIHSDGINHYSMMYRTDHHWTTDAGFYAYKKIEQFISKSTGIHVDPRIIDSSQYNIVTYPQWHLGSRGQQTGTIFSSGADDFNLYIPKFNTKIKDSKGNIGQLQDIALNLEPLKKRNYYTQNTYDSVLGKSLNHYQNLNCENDAKLLLVTDSFGKAVAPFLIMSYSEITYNSDLETYNITPQYMMDYNPQIVILLYYSGNVNEPEAFSFNGF